MAIMTDRNRVSCVAATLLACLSLAAWTGTGDAAVPDRAVVIPYEDAKFTPIDPSQPEGPQIAVLLGDPGTGPSSMLMKFGRMPGRLHYHTADYELVVLEGRMKHWVEGQVEAETPTLGPGSYWRQPRRQPHGDSCLTDVCVMFIKWSAKRDAIPAVSPEEREKSPSTDQASSVK
jgi:quercetin dioxygenase-like cupin family protein